MCNMFKNIYKQCDIKQKLQANIIINYRINIT